MGTVATIKVYGENEDVSHFYELARKNIIKKKKYYQTSDNFKFEKMRYISK